MFPEIMLGWINRLRATPKPKAGDVVIRVTFDRVAQDIASGGSVSKAMLAHYASRPRGPLKDLH